MSGTSATNVPTRHSIVTRFTVAITIVVFISALLAGALVYEGSRAQMTRSAENDMRRSLQLARLNLSAFARAMGQDVDFLATNAPVQDLVALMDTLPPDSVAWSNARNRLAVLLESFMRTRPLYAQVRMLGADSMGMELVRYDRTLGGVSRVPQLELQPKADRDYYRATMRLFPGQRYFSPIDLNREHGVVVVPHMPTIRAAVPLFTAHGGRAGIVVINADLRSLFKELTSLQGAHEQLLMANADGELLLHPDTARTFRFDLGGSYTLNDELGSEVVLDSVIQRGGRMLRFERAGVEELPRDHILGITVELDTLLAGIRRERDRSLLISLSVAALFALISLFFARAAARRIQRIAARMEDYTGGTATEHLPTERKDEIGSLSHSLASMQERIDLRVAELNEARHQAEESDRKRRELLANVSHEVRTPLNAIIGLSEGIDPNGLTDGDRERLGIVQRSARRLKALVDDLLLHARIGEGMQETNPVPTNVLQVAEDVLQAYRKPAADKGLALLASFGLVPPHFGVDPLRLHQVLDNLIGNAIKYTAQGQVELNLRMNARAALEITVRDTGKGLTEQEQQRVFQRFERAASAENETDSTGLGLAITQRLVQFMGGSIAVSSEVGRGSMFRVELPEANVQGQMEPVAPASSAAADTSTAGLRVLYVEDTSTNRLLMEQWGAQWKWELTMAATPEEAITLCKTGSFDVLLIDMDLGESMRGSELTMRLRGSKRSRYIPVLMVTAYVDAEHEAEALRAGANERITKPIERAELLASIRFWCKDEEARVDLTTLEAQYDGDPEQLLAMYKQFRKEFVEKRLALVAADGEALQRVYHQLRPHWEMLGLSDELHLLDPSEVRGRHARHLAIEGVLARCDRAMMRRQRALMELIGGPAA